MRHHLRSAVPYFPPDDCSVSVMKILTELAVSARLAAFAGIRFACLAALAFFVFFLVILLILRFVDPPTSAVMIRDRLAGAHVQYHWTPLEKVSRNLVRAVISSEDSRFCRHFGIDLREMSHAMQALDQRGIGSVRGASTITMQVAKNLFLWTDRSLLRKALELSITPIIEIAWPKRRILEVYLNIAQWGPGLFGIAAAAREHFGHEPSQLTVNQSALLTATLPAPSIRRAGAANAHTRRVAARVKRRMRPGNVDVGCVGI
jgi:monofunctional biosynthetic peptidoglycan transglycosylase